MDDLISVIMSTYNESIAEISESVDSILRQTYSNLELIIIIDNPDNIELCSYLYTLKDSRIRIIKNENNIGLVKSLNKAISYAHGKYIARMDADDISECDRLKSQKQFMDENQLDFVGGCIQLIDEKGKYISNLHFPTSQYTINFFLKWGSCIPHPTWLLKKEVYIRLNGYRDIPRCEDYEFICRAIHYKYKIANIDQYVLKYRIRSKSISNSKKASQYILRRFISKNRKKNLSELDVKEFIQSKQFEREVQEYEEFQMLKMEMGKKPSFICLFKISMNYNTYCLGLEKIFLKFRNLI